MLLHAYGILKSFENWFDTQVTCLRHLGLRTTAASDTAQGVLLS
ncbi:hypothetical protein Dfer_5382 [Dyadobacter fermentans DSM 18053]|uniref:Uncharacterized protein n=1 Tax=Dyadobacter fermentans (strain ATCC 700827 / DSM 18053 / CIP 107007 / KCTC 52180 / NS114) TaxID=471854 RepID=C6VU93_DYAFD|nr:hypothetical protein Dfer_5382 [Dyadobacter fermentans DSM 18053]